MPKSPSREGQGYPCPRNRKTKKPSSAFTRRSGRRSLLFRLVSTGIGRTAAAATLSWAAQFGIETDWSMTQLADHGECDRKTISNAMPALKKAGFVEQVSDHLFLGFKKPGNRSGIYRFTEEFYAMLGKARKAPRRRENFPTPSALEVPISTVPTNVQHQHEDQEQGSNAMPVPKNLKEELREGVETPVESVVEDRVEPIHADQITKTLMEAAGLDEGGARAAAKALPSACSGELVKFLIQAAQEVVGQRGQGVRNPKAYLHRLLTSGDQGILRTARKLYEDSKATAKVARSLGVDQVLRQSHPSFRALPGAFEAIQECLRAKRELEALPADHNSRLFYNDQLGKAKTAVVDLAARAIGAGGPPQSILDRRAWRRRVLRQAGLHLDEPVQPR